MLVVLFDIDGTLIRAGKGSRSAIAAALENEFRVPSPDLEVEYAGNTDYAIGRNLLTHNGLEASPENVTRLWLAYGRFLSSCLELHRPIVLPGVLDAVREICGDTKYFFSALMTGNTERTAWIKLHFTPLNGLFHSGVFGDHCPDRTALARLGQDFVRDQMSPGFPDDRVIVIGDTLKDLSCARAIGAKCVIVGTGYADSSVLKAADPDLFIDDFTSPLLREFLYDNRHRHPSPLLRSP